MSKYLKYSTRKGKGGADTCKKCMRGKVAYEQESLCVPEEGRVRDSSIDGDRDSGTMPPSLKGAVMPICKVRAMANASK